MWNTWLVAVVWYKPPNKPKPLSINSKCTLFIQSKKQQTRIAITIRAYKMDLSRLIATAFEHNNDNIEKIII